MGGGQLCAWSCAKSMCQILPRHHGIKTRNPCLQAPPNQRWNHSKREKEKKESTGEINNNYLFWQIMSVRKAICAHSSVPAPHQQGPSQKLSFPLGRGQALHQPVRAWGKECHLLVSSLLPYHLPGGWARAILKIQLGLAWGCTAPSCQLLVVGILVAPWAGRCLEVRAQVWFLGTP